MRFENKYSFVWQLRVKNISPDSAVLSLRLEDIVPLQLWDRRESGGRYLSTLEANFGALARKRFAR